MSLTSAPGPPQPKHVWCNIHYFIEWTRLFSIESQPKKIVVAVVVGVVVVVIPVVDIRSIPLKFGLNQVINRWDVGDVVVVSVFVFVVVVVVVIVVLVAVVDPIETYL